MSVLPGMASVATGGPSAPLSQEIWRAMFRSDASGIVSWLRVAKSRREILKTFGAWAMTLLTSETGAAPPRQHAIDRLLAGHFDWTVSPPLVSPATRPDDPCHAIKDPSIVFYQGRWHLFCTIRSRIRSHQIEYLSFVDFPHANAAERHVLRLTDGYCAAPQIFYYSPHQRWYLLYQVVDRSRKPPLQPAYSTTRDVTDPASWTAPILLFPQQPDYVTKWIDFWVICDATRAHLFFTSLDGQMWRAETKVSDFPVGWSQPSVVLRDDVFEASHTYRLKGLDKFLTVIEAQVAGLVAKLLAVAQGQAGGRRYYKAYLADRLDGIWVPLATTFNKPFAGSSNVHNQGSHWTDSISHGEMIRAGYDEMLEVEPADCRFLFQGVSDQARVGKTYGEIPWQLGLLEAVH